ncbi:MAG: histidine phosphatase family protein [Anaerolineae bacterium]|nr:histidine phosphatase family protein [Anaerolineae bacterium]
MLTRVFIIRHGETDYNAAGRWQGILQTSLNETGRRQAQALAQHLRTQPLDAIYSSDLIRAYDTAQYLAQGRPLSVISDQRLREINAGVFQGLNREEIQRTYPLEYSQWQKDNHFIVPQGESRAQMQARMVAAWQEIVTRTPGHSAAMVSHGGSIRYLLLHLFPDELSAGRGIENTSITTLERDGPGWRLAEFAALPHLHR